MENQAQVIMWIVGTGIVVLVAFIGVLTTALGKKVDSIMCIKVHEMLDEKLADLSKAAKENADSLHNMSLTIEKIRGMLEGQIRTEASRWDRSDKNRKGE